MIGKWGWSLVKLHIVRYNKKRYILKFDADNISEQTHITFLTVINYKKTYKVLYSTLLDYCYSQALGIVSHLLARSWLQQDGGKLQNHETGLKWPQFILTKLVRINLKLCLCQVGHDIN